MSDLRLLPSAFNAGAIYRSPMDYYRLKLSKSKLKAVTRTSALLSGFAMVAMVELGLNYNDYFDAAVNGDRLRMQMQSTSSNGNLAGGHIASSANSTSNQTKTATVLDSVDLSSPANRNILPEPLLVAYALVTCLLVGVHMLALMISTCILPQIEASSLEQFEYEQLYKYDHSGQQQQQHGHYGNGSRHQVDPTAMMEVTSANSAASPSSRVITSTQAAAADSSLLGLNMNMTSGAGGELTDLQFPYKKFHRFIELAWISSTVLGILLFLIEIGLVCFIKFYPISVLAALSGVLVMVPIIILFVLFTYTFYRRVADFKMSVTEQLLYQVNHNLIPMREHQSL